MRAPRFVLLLVVLAASCGRTGLFAHADRSDAAPDTAPDTPSALPDSPRTDASVAEVRDGSPADPPVDPRGAPAEPPRDLPSDNAFAEARPETPPGEVAAEVSDGRGVEHAFLADVAAAETGPATACGALKPLADQGVLTRQRTREVTFAPDRSWVALKVRQEAPPGIGYPAQLLRVALPSGEVTMVSSAGGTAEALAPSGLLVVGADPEGKSVAVYENGTLRTLAGGACAHLAAPDGSRVYVVRDCDSSARGTLDVVDVASGTPTTLASSVLGQRYWNPDYAVSPSGAYFAFLVQSSDAGATSNILHVADRRGKVYALPSQPGAVAPWFASDELLLFAVGGTGYPFKSSLRAHVPGSGDTSYSLATDRTIGFFGYEVSADQRWLLAAAEAWSDAGNYGTGLLYAIHLDGTGENLVSKDLLPFWVNQLAINAFEWTGDGSRAIYMADRGAGNWASDSYGAAAAKLSPGGWFRTAPLGDQVAFLESTGDARQNQLRVVQAGSGQELLTFGTDGSLTAPNFTPDARGLLFVDIPASGARHLRYLSTAFPGSLVLGDWTETLLDTYPGSYADPPGRYPMDPTGCFTVVDTDLAPGPGTRLVLLPG
jgi:hypothetical protein